MVMPRLLDLHRGTPLVLDADALWLAADAANALGTDTASMLRHWTREAPHVVCTPHPGEFARLLGVPLPDDWDERAALLAQFAARANCTVLLKGTPTLIATPEVEPLWVVPHGTPVLATGGSGDCLTGIIGTLLAQGASARDAAVVGATWHGRAAERVTAERGTTRGVTLDDVLLAIGPVWASFARDERQGVNVLAELPAVPQ
jgi:NAD(P)H-hydrate epimerase